MGFQCLFKRISVKNLGKRKLIFFEEIKTFSNVTEFNEDKDKLDSLKNNWSQNIFKNTHPIVLELACGKGEYTNELAKTYPDKNFIGVDIKGDRINRAAKVALKNKCMNVHFLRIEIQFLDKFFSKDEVDEIWITFPDPLLKGKNRDKRLTSSKYLNLYKSVLKKNGIVHLKTDSITLFNFTLNTIHEENHTLLYKTNDLYNEKNIDAKLIEIQTTYEKRYLAEKKKINYVKFKLN